jgi:hypothetical protein
MNNAITFVQFFSDRTIIHCALEPNWLERVVLRRKTRRISYLGRDRKWQKGSLSKGMRKCGWLMSLKLWKIEQGLIKLARKRNAKTLRFT